MCVALLCTACNRGMGIVKMAVFDIHQMHSLSLSNEHLPFGCVYFRRVFSYLRKTRGRRRRSWPADVPRPLFLVIQLPRSGFDAPLDERPASHVLWLFLNPAHLSPPCTRSRQRKAGRMYTNRELARRVQASNTYGGPYLPLYSFAGTYNGKHSEVVDVEKRGQFNR